MFRFIVQQFKNFFSFLKTLFFLFFFLILQFLDILTFRTKKLDDLHLQNNLLDLKQYNYFNSRVKKKNLYKFLFSDNSFFLIDLLSLLTLSYKYKNKNNNINLFRAYFRVLNTKSGFYFNFNTLKNNKNFIDTFKFIFLSGLKSIWYGLRFWIIPLLVGFALCTI